jgi:hypothetical protein
MAAAAAPRGPLCSSALCSVATDSCGVATGPAHTARLVEQRDDPRDGRARARRAVVRVEEVVGAHVELERLVSDTAHAGANATAGAKGGPARSAGGCGRGEPGPGADVGKGEPSRAADVGRGESSPGAEVAGASPVPVQMWRTCAAMSGKPAPDAFHIFALGSEGVFR